LLCKEFPWLFSWEYLWFQCASIYSAELNLLSHLTEYCTKSLKYIPWFLKFSRVKYRRLLVVQTKMLKWQCKEFFRYKVFIIRQYVAFVQLNPNGCVCMYNCVWYRNLDNEAVSVRFVLLCARKKKYVHRNIWRLVPTLPFHYRQIRITVHAALCSRSVGKIFLYFFNSLKCVITHFMPSLWTNIVTIIVVQCKIFNFRHFSFNLFSSSKKNKWALCGITQRGTLWLMYRSSVLWHWRLGGYGALARYFLYIYIYIYIFFFFFNRRHHDVLET